MSVQGSTSRLTANRSSWARVALPSPFLQRPRLPLLTTSVIPRLRFRAFRTLCEVMPRRSSARLML